jgi:hypothetical protein
MLNLLDIQRGGSAVTAIEQTAQVLRPWLGSDFVAAHASLMQRISLRLTQFIPSRDSLQTVAQDLDSLLFLAVRDQTSGRMLLRMDDGKYIRVRVADFTTMADELLYILMEHLPAVESNYRLISEYSMHAGSLSALRALYDRYQAFQSEEEYRTVIRIIKTCHPPFRWRGWLAP